MAAVEEAVLRSIAVWTQGRWQEAEEAVSEQRTQGEGLVCRREGQRLSRECSLEAGSCEEAHILDQQGLVGQQRLVDPR